MNLNRNYIGFEIEKKYYDIAVNRIKEHKLELDNGI
jgi:DNA modification methylase